MTKIRHLAFNDLRSNPDSENAPIFRANHSPWPQSAFPASPTTLTSEQLQMFINKAPVTLKTTNACNKALIKITKPNLSNGTAHF